MPLRLRSGRPLVIVAAAVGVAGLLAAPAASAGTVHHAAVKHVSTAQVGGLIEACPPVPAGRARCLAESRPGAWLGDAAHPAAAAATYFDPAHLRAAYHLPSTTRGSGQTVAIVDAYDDPNAAADLAFYRSHYGLPACTVANGCFTKVDQTGGSNYPSPDAGWIAEESLDLDMVSAVCPNCHITLVEATSDEITDLGTAVNEAVTLGAKFVTNSWGASEGSDDLTWDTSYFTHPGVVLTAATGDGGYAGGVGWPASSPNVTAVGGTSLKPSTNARGWTESAWSGAQSGCSSQEPKPAFQHDTGCSQRTEADVSAVADPNTGVYVYDSTTPPDEPGPGWFIYGGTSASSPIVAATYALAGTPGSSDTPVSYPYAHTNTLNDVGSGNDGSCPVSESYLCTAKSGYDGPTGLGTLWGTAAYGASTSAVGEVWSWVHGKCLDDHSAKTTNANPIDLWSCNNSAAQSVTVEANGSIQILGKCLDDYHAGTANGSKVDLYDCNGTTAQHWSWGPNGELINWHAGKCIDDPGSSKTNGVQLVLWSCTGTNPESWQLP
jgi:Ricin-type beta-trefoil lectin domain